MANCCFYITYLLLSYRLSLLFQYLNELHYYVITTVNSVIHCLSDSLT